METIWGFSASRCGPQTILGLKGAWTQKICGLCKLPYCFLGWVCGRRDKGQLCWYPFIKKTHGGRGLIERSDGGVVVKSDAVCCLAGHADFISDDPSYDWVLVEAKLESEQVWRDINRAEDLVTLFDDDKDSLYLRCCADPQVSLKLEKKAKVRGQPLTPANTRCLIPSSCSSVSLLSGRSKSLMSLEPRTCTACSQAGWVNSTTRNST